MSLEKLTILHEQKTEDLLSGKIKALFNPSELTFNKSVTWKTDKVLSDGTTTRSWTTSFQGVEPETLRINLFYDTFEEAGQLKGSIWRYLYSYPSVLEYTQELAALARYCKELHRPPKCKLQWGKTTLFIGVLASVNQHITLFLDDGTPVRATMDCSFREFNSDSDTVRDELNSPDVDKRYVVRPGDTLTRIAAELYADQSLWRVIAEANGIDNPRRLTPGQVLLIPKLT